MNFVAAKTNKKLEMERLTEVYVEAKKNRWRVKEEEEQMDMLQKWRLRVHNGKVDNLEEVLGEAQQRQETLYD